MLKALGMVALMGIALAAETSPLDAIAAKLTDKRVVFIGETHDRFDHHLNQLAMIQRLHAADPNMAIGVEYFQQPFQAQVDDYIAGRTTENEFLRATEYFERWGYDYRLYAPLFRYAREQHIPVRALNVPSDVVSTVAKSGFASLSTPQRAYLPNELVPADEGYKKRLREAFAAHKDTKPGAFEHFVEAQLTWDEGMAQSAAAYLTTNPNRRMVILAGSGHLMFGSGIPQRLDRRVHAPSAILLTGGGEIEPPMADFILPADPQELPPAGVLGVTLETRNGMARIKTLSPGGSAEKAGLKKGDAIAEVDGEKIRNTADLRLLLWEKNPGDQVRVLTKRGPFEATLQAPPKRH